MSLGEQNRKMKIDLRRGSTPGFTEHQMMVQHSKLACEYPNSKLRDPLNPNKPLAAATQRLRKSWTGSSAGAVYLLTFLIPLFVLPNVPSALELNKQVLLVLLGGIAFLAWIGKLAWEGRIRIKKNFLLVPVLILADCSFA